MFDIMTGIHKKSLVQLIFLNQRQNLSLEKQGINLSSVGENGIYI